MLGAEGADLNLNKLGAGAESCDEAEALKPDEKEEKTMFDIFLIDAGSNKVGVIKVVREITGLSMVEAKRIVEQAPTLLKGGVSKEEAEVAKKALEEVGAVTEEKEKTVFDIFLIDAALNKVGVITVVRAITGLSMVEAKRLVEQAPTLVKGGVSKEEAEVAKKALEEVGGVVSIR